MSGIYMGLALLGGKYSGFCKSTIANLRRGTVVEFEPLPQGDLREIKTVA
jgi:hypothetical protein